MAYLSLAWCDVESFSEIHVFLPLSQLVRTIYWVLSLGAHFFACGRFFHINFYNMITFWAFFSFEENIKTRQKDWAIPLCSYTFTSKTAARQPAEDSPLLVTFLIATMSLSFRMTPFAVPWAVLLAGWVTAVCISFWLDSKDGFQVKRWSNIVENRVLPKILSSGKYFLNGSPEKAGSRMFFLKPAALSRLWKGSKGLLLWHSFLTTETSTAFWNSPDPLVRIQQSDLELEPGGALPSASATQWGDLS